MSLSHPVELRAATPADTDAIAAIWYRGWPDGHLGHVPEALQTHRQLADFRRRVPGRLALTTVATVDARVVGFAMVRDDELEQLYVEQAARGSGVAAALIEHAERRIAERFDLAWLAVVAGNARALRFYERSGWVDAGAIDYDAPIEGGAIRVACRRYEKRVPARRDAEGG